MPRKIVPFQPDIPRIRPKDAERRLGVSRNALYRYIENGDLTLVATAPKVQANILESSVDALLDRINAVANAQ